ncbi:MAG: RNA polymerase factor sigma-54 [Gammaproteobacteria bacterium]|nr:RNA polymerase factor sigma-54 [Gammaproteobacteria bacterium]
MKPTLALKLGQQLRMTPQLQQAIRLLQLSTTDLELEIQEALDSNPMLEELLSDELNESEEPTSLDPPEAEPSTDQKSMDEGQISLSDPEVEGESIPDTSEEVSADIIAEELPVDSVWEDTFDDGISAANFQSSNDTDDYFDDRNSEDISIQSHLLEQINLLRLTDRDEFIALSIIDGLDNEGMLTIPLTDIMESAPVTWELEIEEVEAVLHLIQHLDPLGIAARDLGECLTIQLESLPDNTPWKQEAVTIVQQYIQQLANRDYTLIARKTRLKELQLKEVLSLILSLNPKPGSNIAANKVEYIEPDVFVSKRNNRWVVELNQKSAPRIRVNPEYVSMIKRSDNSRDNMYLKDHLQEARWFIKSLRQRNDTLLRVATKIVEFQKGFFEYGEQAMKPLVLHDIARAVDLHESTISRVTSQKYMHIPSGVYELKYFFSSHVSTSNGGEISSTAIRALIKELVSKENPGKPLSDSKIAGLLAARKINVARRTIAKYRESLLIPPSNERKQLF